MYRITRTFNPIHLRPTVLPTPTLLRTFHTTQPYYASSDKGPELTQGHSTQKSKDPIHRDSDVTSASERAASNARSRSASASSAQGDSQPLDAAQQGSDDGTVKPSPNKDEMKDKGQKGSMADQVGGQDDSSKGPGVVMGDKEEAAGGSIGDSVKKSLGFEKLKDMRKDGRNYHTSSRILKDKMSTPKSPREPKEAKLPGDQNQHLKHKDPKSKDSGKGNAAADPKLPSKKPTSTKGKAGAAAGALFHTSAIDLATKPPGGYAKAKEPESTKDGYDAPPQALPSTLDSPYSSEATQQADTDTTIPSSQQPYSSTAQDPPNDALRQSALDGTLGERNGQPNEEIGKKGIDDAWKHRK